jgi:hypothetical protein
MNNRRIICHRTPHQERMAGVAMKIKIQPKLTPISADGSVLDGHLAPRIEAAKRWLGDRYLLAKPINKRKFHA